MSSEKSNEVLATELNGLAKEVAELKGLFNAFQTNFLRADIYTVRHEELVAKVAKLEKDSTTYRSDIDQAKGAVMFLRVAISLLAAVSAIGLWWVKR